MELPLDDALQYLDQIMEFQKEIDQVNEDEYQEKWKLKEEGQDKLRWDEENECLRHPYITKLEQGLFDRRRELVKLIPNFWPTALFADQGLLRFMNKEEQKVFKFLKSLDVIYHGDAKSGYTIQFYMDEKNPYFDNLILTKTFTFTRKGISCGKGSEIRWEKDKDIEVFAEKGGTQQHTAMPSFFKWFQEASEKFDKIADEIVRVFWPNAHTYYFTGMKRGEEKGVQMLTEEERARKKFEGEGKALEADIPGTLSELMTISDELRVAKEQATEERNTLEEEHQAMLAKEEMEVHKKCESLRRSIYDRRSEIFRRIHHFWLIAFLSHYALHHLLSKEDQKILKFLNSVNVKETDDAEGVISGYIISLDFDVNPYFENRSLTKEISYTVMSADPQKEYSDGDVNISASNINWKDGSDTTTRYPQGSNDSRRFFTWFSNLGCVGNQAYDEVANLIKQDFWPNAGKYFINGNMNDEKEVDLTGISKMKYYTSPLRTFLIHIGN